MEEWSGRVSVSDRPAQMRKASATYAARLQRAGLRRIALWVPEDRATELRAIAAGMCSIDESPSQ